MSDFGTEVPGEPGMPNQLSMASIQSIETLHCSGHSNREIARILSFDRGAVNKYVRRLRTAEAPPAMPEAGSEDSQNRPNLRTGSDGCQFQSELSALFQLQGCGWGIGDSNAAADWVLWRLMTTFKRLGAELALCSETRPSGKALPWPRHSMISPNSCKIGTATPENLGPSGFIVGLTPKTGHLFVPRCIYGLDWTFVCRIEESLLLLGEILAIRQPDILRFAQRIIAVGHQLAILSTTYLVHSHRRHLLHMRSRAISCSPPEELPVPREQRGEPATKSSTFNAA
jgi:hypothetical protein